MLLEVTGHDAVGGDHELLDQLFRPVLILGLQIGQHSVTDHRTRLDGLEAQRTTPVARRFQSLCDPVLQPQLRVEPGYRGERTGRRRLTAQPGGHTPVSQLRAVAYECAIDVRLRDRSRAADRHLDDDAQAILVLSQRGQVGREFFRQHREDLRRGVHGSGVRARVLIERRADLHQAIDVRHRDQNPHAAIGGGICDRELIQIT